MPFRLAPLQLCLQAHGGQRGPQLVAGEGDELVAQGDRRPRFLGEPRVLGVRPALREVEPVDASRVLPDEDAGEEDDPGCHQGGAEGVVVEPSTRSGVP